MGTHLTWEQNEAQNNIIGLWKEADKGNGLTPNDVLLEDVYIREEALYGDGTVDNSEDGRGYKPIAA
jgi:hypothetical protein